ncbi:MAG: hypothetical protein JO107_06075, partial [Hyphomicrobiales bacterium]|nr:hypothetical protein [Hyphomicrobiales bacterium]
MGIAPNDEGETGGAWFDLNDRVFEATNAELDFVSTIPIGVAVIVEYEDVFQNTHSTTRYFSGTLVNADIDSEHGKGEGGIWNVEVVRTAEKLRGLKES